MRNNQYNKNFSLNIEDYLSGHLSGKELELFKKELMTDSNFQANVVIRKEIETALCNKNLIELRTLLNNIPKSKVGYSKGINFRNKVNRIWQIAAASLVIVLLTGGLWYTLSSKSYSSERLITEYYKAPHAVGQSRSVEYGSDNALKEAFNYYQQNDYTNALKCFRTLDNQVTAKFYSGVCYIELGQYQEATDFFEFVINDKDNLFIEQAEWYIGLIYLMNNDKDKAFDHFNKISKADSFYTDQAQEILKYLK